MFALGNERSKKIKLTRANLAYENERWLGVFDSLALSCSLYSQMEFFINFNRASERNIRVSLCLYPLPYTVTNRINNR